MTGAASAEKSLGPKRHKQTSEVIWYTNLAWQHARRGRLAEKFPKVQTLRCPTLKSLCRNNGVIVLPRRHSPQSASHLRTALLTRIRTARRMELRCFTPDLGIRRAGVLAFWPSFTVSAPPHNSLAASGCLTSQRVRRSFGNPSGGMGVGQH
jgi:hypothetical protein